MPCRAVLLLLHAEPNLVRAVLMLLRAVPTACHAKHKGCYAVLLPCRARKRPCRAVPHFSRARSSTCHHVPGVSRATSCRFDRITKDKSGLCSTIRSSCWVQLDGFCCRMRHNLQYASACQQRLMPVYSRSRRAKHCTTASGR